jgi:hypothetical protein
MEERYWIGNCRRALLWSLKASHDVRFFGKGARIGLALAASLSGAYAVGRAIVQSRTSHPHADFWPHEDPAKQAELVGPHSHTNNSVGPGL